MGQTLKQVLVQARLLMPRTLPRSTGLSSKAPASTTNVAAVKARAQAGQYLVAAGAGVAGRVVDALRGTDELDEVAFAEPACRKRRNVEDDRVHRNAPDEGQTHALEPGGRSGAPVPAVG